MTAWTVISSILQLATIYLVGQGGITLSLAGFRPRDVNPAMKELRFWLNFVAGVSFGIAVAAIVCLLTLAEAFSRPHFAGEPEEVAKANQALRECLNAPQLGPRHGTPDAEGAAWQSLHKYRDCAQEVAKRFNVRLVYDRSFIDFFTTNARLTAALFGLIFVIPGLVYFSTRLRVLNVNENRPRLIMKACAEIYAGIILQVFLEVAGRLGSFIVP